MQNKCELVAGGVVNDGGCLYSLSVAFVILLTFNCLVSKTAQHIFCFTEKSLKVAITETHRKLYDKNLISQI